VVVRRAYVATVAEDRITAHGRELGVELRRRRELAGYNGLELANRLGWSTTKVSRVETGARIISEVDIAIYLASCGVPRLEMDGILDLAREANYDHRLKSHGEKLPDELRTLIFHETTAVEIDSYESVFVPGLLQTEDYARALFLEADQFRGDSIGFRVQARMDRQGLLRRSYPPQCTFYLHENAIRTRIGSAQIMHEQLLHLIFLTSWRHCVIRVIPRSANGVGLASTSFHRMSYVDHDPVVEIDLETKSLFLDRKSDTERYRKVLNRLDTVALDEGQSRGVLADLASVFERAEDGHDG
jgi:transcriptional regulator with XRE-family HTH domain